MTRNAWEKITKELDKECGTFFLVNTVQCKWKYLVNKYNKVKEYKSSTGKERKEFSVCTSDLDRFCMIKQKGHNNKYVPLTENKNFIIMKGICV